MISPILSLCARVQSHSGQQLLLEKACNGFSEWETLLSDAEAHGMAPLLYRHLSFQEGLAPATFLRGLRFLCLRHQQANFLLMECLRQILLLFKQNSIPSLLLKGGSLCQTLYPEVGLRPMRDIDILLKKEDAFLAHDILQNHGYVCSTEKTPKGYYHLPALHKKLNGMEICVELHHGIFPNDPPYYQQLSYKDFYRTAQSFEIEGTTAYTLATEDMLYHLYQHGFHAPLTFEPYKLISIADIVSLVEEKAEELNWNLLEKKYPQVLHALPLFHHITPWSNALLQKVPFLIQTRPRHVAKPYSGWPRCTFVKEKPASRLKILKETLFPGQWWLMLYYNTNGVCSLIFCRIVHHPLHLLRWVKIYGGLFLKRGGGLSQRRTEE